MAQRSHVPKFGTWEGENVAYTAFFETARKGRGVGGRIINPNDPEERHELITSSREEQIQDHAAPPSNIDHIINAGKTHQAGVALIPPSTTTANNNNNISPGEQGLQQEKQHHGKEADDASSGHMRSPNSHDPAQHNRDGSTMIDIAPRNRHNKDRSNSPGFGRSSEEGDSSTSSSAHSHQDSLQIQGKNNNIQVRRQRRDYSPATSPQRPMAPRTKNNHQAQQHRRAASVPKFGAWDTTSPQAAAGFTMIFDRVKEERHQAVNKLPTPVTSPVPYSPQERMSDHERQTKSNKRFCCFLPMVDQ